MTRNQNFFSITAAVILLAAAGAAFAGRVENFNSNWRFFRGAQPGAEAVAFDDSAWEKIRLPHDWAISGPYEPSGDCNTGKLPWRGEGWYRKHFTPNAEDAGKRVYLDFDGVMAMPTVYVNGRKAGGWDYGYMSFRVDASPFVKFGAANLVAVHVDTRNHNSRWYPGAGIYRKVQLVLCDPIHVAHWGVAITTPRVTDDAATVKVRTEIENHETPALISLETLVLDSSNRTVAQGKVEIPNAAAGATVVTQDFAVLRPRRWDLTSPHLYHTLTRIYRSGRLIDSATNSFGIRTFEFTADDGFHLNGRRVQLKGVNLHHDQGPLGAAFYVRAMERQLEIMQDMGVNAIRTSHNPPAPELLDLCDRMGFVVWDEAFDKWDGTSTRPKEVGILEHNRKQVENFVRRDRNHPSVVVWSAGNEIWDLEGGKLPDSPGLLRQMVSYFHELDPTRPVGLAHAVPESARTPLDDSLDVTGWNYQRRYAISREKRPQLPILYSESASALSTRGHYELPHPAKKDDFSNSLRLSSYDLNSASWSDLADTEFALMERDRFVAGEFVWTGFDYLGEPTPFVADGWGKFEQKKITRPEGSRSSLFGIVDLAGIPKDRYYLYRSYWAPEKKTIHLLPHWNWPDRLGSKVPVYVYTSGDSAEIFLNGKSLGRKTKTPGAQDPLDRYRLRWEDVTYEPGEVRAVAYSQGRRLGEAVMRTAGPPARLRLTPDRKKFNSGGDDLCYLLVEATDSQGNLAALAMNEVRFRVSGPAVIAGVANGDHHFPAEFATDHVALFYGKAMLVLRSAEAETGSVRVEAQSANLAPGEVAVRVVSP
jgi:beta-galactosidase